MEFYPLHFNLFLKSVTKETFIPSTTLSQVSSKTFLEESFIKELYSSRIAGIQSSYIFPFASTNFVQFIQPFGVSKDVLW